MLTSALFPNHRGTTGEMKSNQIPLAPIPRRLFRSPELRRYVGLPMPTAAKG